MHARVAHLVRRGVEHLARRQQDVEPMPGEGSGDGNLPGFDMNLTTMQAWSIAFTTIVGVLALYAISYTLGQLMSTLAIIESPSGHRTNESIPPPTYTDATNDDPLLRSDADAEPVDLETMAVVHSPITSKIRTTMAHLSRIGGFRARFRGLGFGLAYNIVFSVLTQISSYGMGAFGQVVMTIIMSIALARLHLYWTHSMIASPQSKKWRRLPKLRDCTPLVLPALIYAFAQQAGVIPFLVADALLNKHMGDGSDPGMLTLAAGSHKDTAVARASVFAVLVTFAAVTLLIIIPASITLTRIEAFLLPDGDETIVPFDKGQILGNIDMNARGSNRALLLRAWQTFSRDGWWRLFKLCAKLTAIEFAGFIVLVVLILIEMVIFG